MKIIFMGTPDIAVPSLETLIGSCHEVAAVITQPDQKSGRGMSVKYSPVKETALRHGIKCFQPEKVSDPGFLDMLEQEKADIFCVAAYAQKIPDRLLNMARFGCINMHPSLLPRYRGSGPLRGPVMNGDDMTGVTIMQLNSEWDAGDILKQESFTMDKKETALTLEEKCSVLGARLMLETVDELEAGTAVPVPQDHTKATYLKQIRKEDGLIDFNDPAVNIERQIRACIPWPSAYTYMGDKVFKIWEADTADLAPADVPSDVCPGMVVYADKNGILISTGSGYLKPLSVQLEGKKRMAAADFLRGNRTETGFIFGKSFEQ